MLPTYSVFREAGGGGFWTEHILACVGLKGQCRDILHSFLCKLSWFIISVWILALTGSNTSYYKGQTFITLH